MTFAKAVRTCFQKYVTIEGRARRAEYWWFFLFMIAVSLVLSVVDSILFGPDFGILGSLFALGVFLPAICVAIRRLHDRDMSGWWALLYFIPVLGSLILLVVYALPGTSGPNRFGPDPLGGGGDGGHNDGDYATSSIPKSGRS